MENFILFLAGYNKSIIDSCKVDKHNAKIIGTVLLLVWIYATVAWFFFFQTVFEGWLIPLLMGFFMGFFILAFDRALIASLSVDNVKEAHNENVNNNWDRFINLLNKIKWGVIFRLFLAILLGIFLSQPMILRFYRSDINREAKLLKEEKVKEYKSSLDSIYYDDLANLQLKITRENNKVEEAFLNLQNAEEIFNLEQDSRGGTGIYGYGAVAKKKELDKERYLNEYIDIKQESDTIKKGIEKEIYLINDHINFKVDSFSTNTPITGTLIQAESLKSLIKKDKTNTLWFRYILLALILTLIELSAIISKFFFKTSSYHIQISSINESEINTLESNQEIYLHSLSEFKESLKKSESETIKDFFEKIKCKNITKVEKLINEWNADINEKMNYKDICQLFMDKFIIQGIGFNKDSNDVEIKQKNKEEKEEQYYKNINRVIGNILFFILFTIISSYLLLYFLLPYIPDKQLSYIYNGLTVLGIIMAIYTLINNKRKK